MDVIAAHRSNFTLPDNTQVIADNSNKLSRFMIDLFEKHGVGDDFSKKLTIYLRKFKGKMYNEMVTRSLVIKSEMMARSLFSSALESSNGTSIGESEKFSIAQECGLRPVDADRLLRESIADYKGQSHGR